jgi:hypothetical protein
MSLANGSIQVFDQAIYSGSNVVLTSSCSDLSVYGLANSITSWKLGPMTRVVFCTASNYGGNFLSVVNPTTVSTADASWSASGFDGFNDVVKSIYVQNLQVSSPSPSFGKAQFFSTTNCPTSAISFTTNSNVADSTPICGVRPAAGSIGSFQSMVIGPYTKVTVYSSANYAGSATLFSTTETPMTLNTLPYAVFSAQVSKNFDPLLANPGSVLVLNNMLPNGCQFMTTLPGTVTIPAPSVDSLTTAWIAPIPAGTTQVNVFGQDANHVTITSNMQFSTTSVTIVGFATSTKYISTWAS